MIPRARSRGGRGGAIVFRDTVSSGVHLEGLDVSHAPALAAILRASEAALRRAGLWHRAFHRAAGVEAWIRYVRRAEAADAAVTRVIVSEGVVCGVVGLEEIDAGNLAAAYWGFVSPLGQGRGVGVQASRGIVVHGFGELELERVFARCLVDNEDARRVVERLGMRFEGTLHERDRVGGRFRDAALYSILRAEWTAGSPLVHVRRARPQDASWLAALAGRALARRALARDPGLEALVVEGRGVVIARAAGDGTGELVALALARRPGRDALGIRLLEAAGHELRRRGCSFLLATPATPGREAGAGADRARLARSGFVEIGPGRFARPLAL